MENLIRDLRYAFRMLLKKPAFTAIAVLSLALGIGANTTIFSLVNEIFLRPLPVEEPGRLMTLYTVDARSPANNPLSHLNWKDIREQNEVFESVLGYDWVQMSVSTGGGEPEVLFGQLVSGDYFDTLGVAAVQGRTFLPEEDATLRTHPVVVLSYDFWSQNLGGRPEAVGETIQINGLPFTVVGVAPPEFTGTDVAVQPEMWAPMSMYPVLRTGFNWYEERRGLFLGAIGRLEDGVSYGEAQAHMKLVAERLEREYPDENEGRTIELVPLTQATIPPQLRNIFVASTGMLMGVVALVLLIACANIANLLLARATERRREIAVRLSIGASRGRLITQLLTESIMVAMLGGFLGLGIALWGRKALLGFLPNLPLPITLNLDLALDYRVLLFTLLLALVTGVIFGLVPAIQSTRPGLVAAIKDQTDLTVGENHKMTARNLLVVAQVALSLVALVGAGLFLRSLTAAQDTDTGFDSENLVTVSFDVGLQGYTPEQGEMFFRDVAARARSVPGVASATVAQGRPFQATLFRSVILEGQSEQDRTYVQVNTIYPEYFEVLGIPIVEGRTFTDGDRDGSVPVVIVNETMAKKFWPDQTALGKRFSFFGRPEPVEVVGVAKDIKYNTLGEAPQPYAYEPMRQQYASAVSLIARTAGAPGPVLRTVEREVRAMNPNLPLTSVLTIDELLDNALWGPRTAATLLSIFGLLALTLAAVGVYGVMSYSVNRRRREIGIRMALGAERKSVLLMVLVQGMAVVGIGLAFGLVLAFFVSKALSNLLFVSPTDPVAILITVVVLTLVAAVANFFPARRATGVDPNVVLRYE